MARYGWQRFLKFKITPKFYGATLMTIINLDAYNKLTKAHKNLLEKQGKIYEAGSDAILDAKAKIDNAKLKAAGVKTIVLTGKVGRAYIDTIYRAKWAQNDSLKYLVDYKTLKARMYGAPGS